MKLSMSLLKEISDLQRLFVLPSITAIPDALRVSPKLPEEEEEITILPQLRKKSQQTVISMAIREKNVLLGLPHFFRFHKKV